MRSLSIFGLLCVLLLPSALRAQEPDDAYVAGYVGAILERELRIAKAVVRVRGGVVTLTAASLGSTDSKRVTEIVSRVPGVIRVEIDGDPIAVPATQPKPAPIVAGPGNATETKIEQPSSSVLLKTALLFEPLHADPRWPHFAAAYHSYHGNGDLENVATVSFGESFSIYRQRAGQESQWELGLQAGVFSIFDLDAPSMDLVNADYFIGPVAAWRSGDVSLLGRVYHQSSHLGDEFLINHRANRINISYEVVDLLVSVDVTDALRLYGGGGYIFHSSTDFDPWIAEVGTELMGPAFGGGVRPVAAVDLQAREEHDWHGDVSVRAGVQFENPTAGSMRLQLMFEYFRGRSPNGQFFDEDIEFFGLGLHFYF